MPRIHVVVEPPLARRVVIARAATKTSKSSKAVKSKDSKAAKPKTSKASKPKASKASKSRVTKSAAAKSTGTKSSKKTTSKRSKATKPKTSGAAEAQKTSRPTPSRSPEAIEIGRDLATLAVIRAEQGGQLSVRQREQLRRALLRASVSLEWDTLAASSDDPIKKATEEVTKLARKGTKALAEDLTEELAAKKTEVTRIKKAAAALFKLSETDDFSSPTDISYNHTARDGSQGYLTKTQTVTVTTAKEAQDAAEAIEKKVEGWEKLRELMLVEIKRRQKELEVVDAELSTFVASASTLLHEVFQTLH